MSVSYKLFVFFGKDVNVLGFFDRHYILSRFLLKHISHFSKSYTFHQIEQIIFKSNKVFMLWWTFSTVKSNVTDNGLDCLFSLLSNRCAFQLIRFINNFTFSVDVILYNFSDGIGIFFIK